ncbi:MAG: FAD-binding oxidoreductase, partial [Mycobacteriaceae bacterium]|nr:FAD-binding oxidoreductase [Mycobacteriaceae bacterium]
LLHADELSNLITISQAYGAMLAPHCAAIQPAKLVRGLADAVRARNVRLYEDTHAELITDRRVDTNRGRVTADVVVRATEGYTAQLSGVHRDIVPMYSLMVATAPLPQQIWEQIGLHNQAAFTDARHLRIYGQRTADGRLAFGGRGAPYHFGSRVSPSFDCDARVHAMLRSIVVDLFPALKDITFTHAWGGNLGIPRDWMPSVNYDRTTGSARAGGYVGDGLATTNLAGRTLAAEILDLDNDIRDLPWVGHCSPKWEPEPLRWLGVNAVTLAMAIADKTEQRTGRPSRLAASFWRKLGH